MVLTGARQLVLFALQYNLGHTWKIDASTPSTAFRPSFTWSASFLMWPSAQKEAEVFSTDCGQRLIRALNMHAVDR